MSTLFYPTSGFSVGGSGGGKTYAKNPEELWGKCSEKQARKNANREQFSGGMNRINAHCRAYRFYNANSQKAT